MCKKAGTFIAVLSLMMLAHALHTETLISENKERQLDFI